MFLQLTGNSAFALDWFLFSLINTGLAQGKNRSGFNWFILSLLLGPLATFLLVVFFEKKPSNWS